MVAETLVVYKFNKLLCVDSLQLDSQSKIDGNLIIQVQTKDVILLFNFYTSTFGKMQIEY